MDPNETLQHLLEDARTIRARLTRNTEHEAEWHDIDQVQDEIVRLTESVEDLHEWLSTGGLLPAAWVQNDENNRRVQAFTLVESTTAPTPTDTGRTCTYSEMVPRERGAANRRLISCPLDLGHQGAHSLTEV